MAFANASTHRDGISAINITPLIDVMLVLLVIFMIAAPVLTRTIPVPLAGKPPTEPVAAPDPIRIRIDAAGQIVFAGRPVPASAVPALLSAELARAGARVPGVDVDASGDADYEVVAQVLAAAQDAGVRSIRFKS